jgi:hypothetical protein
MNPHQKGPMARRKVIDDVLCRGNVVLIVTNRLGADLIASGLEILAPDIPGREERAKSLAYQIQTELGQTE